MKLQAPFIQLPLVFDAATLAAEIDALGEAPWRPHPQGFPGNSMLPLVAVNGEPGNEAFSGTMRPTPELLRCPYLTQVFASLGATVGRSRLMRLSGHAEVTRHADQGYYWAERVRVHVPIVTQPTVRFECGDAAINMAAGECWIFDTWRQHRVINDAVESRIHLVVDTVGGTSFWDLVNQGRSPSGPAPSEWRARHVAPGPGWGNFPCESSNVPIVMSPWELTAHMTQLFGDSVPGPALPAVRQAALRFVRTWRAMWAQFGDAPEGHAAFRNLLQSFVEDIRGPAQSVVLVNQLTWFGAFSVMVARVAVTEATRTEGYGLAQQASMGDNA